MKSILTGIGLMVVISVIAWGVLGTQKQSTGEAYNTSSGSVRMDE